MQLLKKKSYLFLAILLAFSGALYALPANAASSCTAPAGAVDSSLVICSDGGTFTARAPISSSGVIAQEIVINIDPSKTSLSSANQITAPAGWTISYFNGTTWSSTAPSTVLGWAAVTRVKASGTLTSQGSANGKQIATNSATAIAPPSGQFAATGNGDGWSVFFDNNNHVFNVFHHDGPSLAVDCHTRTGTSCGPGWPFSVAGFHTNNQSEGWIDNTNKRLWWSTNTSTQSGFACIDISNFASGPAWCGGSAAAAFEATGTSGGASYGYTSDFAAAGSRLFTFETYTGKLMCVDTALNSGLGAPCASQPISFAGITNSYDGANALLSYGGKLYGGTGSTLFCIDPITFVSCTGFPKTITSVINGIYPLPNASGVIQGICTLDQNTNPCYTFGGSSLTRPASLTFNLGPYFSSYGKSPENTGSKLYWASGWNSGYLYCWDASLNSGAGAGCPNFPVTTPANYTAQIDPYNSNCIWVNTDSGGISAWDGILGTQGCTSLPTDVTFDTSLIIPRMGCNATSAISSWQNFTLTGPASNKYQSATLTVTKADGSAISGWSAVPITGSRVIDLSTLNVADSGQKPLFQVKFTQRTGTSPADDAKATVTAVGDQPELCITPDPHYVCPTTLGPLTNLPSQSASISASGTATLTGNVTQNFVGASTTTNLTTPALSACASTLTGNAAGGGGGAPVTGVTVSLLNGAGVAVLDGQGNPVTATTDSSGNYTFGTLAFGAYKVSFPDKSVTQTIGTSTVSSAGSGSTNAASGIATSNVTTLSQGVNGIVNAAYVLPPTAPSRTQIVANGSNVIFDAFSAAPQSMTTGTISAAFASTLSNFTSTKGLTKLCAANEVANACTASTVATPNGTYSVNATSGQVTFTPAVGFSGTADPVTYVVVDAANQKASGVFTPIVAGPTTAVNDSSSGYVDQTQNLNPLANDTLTAGNTLRPNSLKLCGVSPVQSSPNCNLTSLTVPSEGTYTVNSTTGAVTFVPVSGYIGTATAVSYQATDALGSIVSAQIVVAVTPTPPPPPAPSPTATPSPTASPTPSITPSVTPLPPSKLAKPDFKVGLQDTPVTVKPLANDTSAEVKPGTLKICQLGSQTSDCKVSQLDTKQGTWTVNPNGTVTFMPASQFYGKASIGYRARDAKNQVVYSYITVEIPSTPALAYTGAGDRVAAYFLVTILLLTGYWLRRRGLRQR